MCKRARFKVFRKEYWVKVRNFGAKKEGPIKVKGWVSIIFEGGLRVAPKNLGGKFGKGGHFLRRLSPFPGIGRARN